MQSAGPADKRLMQAAITQLESGLASGAGREAFIKGGGSSISVGQTVGQGAKWLAGKINPELDITTIPMGDFLKAEQGRFTDLGQVPGIGKVLYERPDLIRGAQVIGAGAAEVGEMQENEKELRRRQQQGMGY